jgi:hypothetical protein
VIEPLGIMRDRLIEETQSSDWEARFHFFAAGVKALIAAAKSDPGLRETIMQDMHPALFAQAVVSGFGAPPITDRYQAAIYFLSADAEHRETSIAWQRENQDEVQKLLAELPMMHRPSALEAALAELMWMLRPLEVFVYLPRGLLCWTGIRSGSLAKLHCS